MSNQNNENEEGTHETRDAALCKFNAALKEFGISHDPKTGELSEPLVLIAYDSRRRLVIHRMMIFREYFLIIRDDKWDTMRIMYKHVRGFQTYSKTIE
jgi:hypothetical protein